MEDNRLNDPSILDDDELLRVGDMGLEKHIKQMQNPANDFDSKMIKKMSNSNQVNQMATPLNVSTVLLYIKLSLIQILKRSMEVMSIM